MRVSGVIFGDHAAAARVVQGRESGGELLTKGTRSVAGACYVCQKVTFLMWRCGNRACGVMFCTECGIGSCCPRCGNLSTEQAGLTSDIIQFLREGGQESKNQSATVALEADLRSRRAHESRMEAEAKKTNQHLVKLEQERLDLDKARAADDQRHRAAIVRIRSVTSLARAFIEQLLSLPS